MPMKKTPSPTDKHVGSRVRMQRMSIGMSQEKLGEALGLTFQQVQKYEKGTNRIGAARLQQISRALNVPMAFFFDGAPALDETATALQGFAEAGTNYVVDFVSSAEGMLLNKAFARIRDGRVRKRIIDLVQILADDEAPREDAGAGANGDHRQEP